MDVTIDTACGHNQPFGGDDLGRHADDHARIDPVHDIWISGLADADDMPILNADVGLINAGVVDDECVGNDAIECVGLADAGGLAHAVAQHFSAAELAFIAIDGKVAFDFQPQFGVAQANAIAGGGTVNFCVVRSFDFVATW